MEDLRKIVSLFEDRRAFFRDNEAQTRISLINPLLQLLGWDITDPRVVRVEPPVQTLSGKKKADYILYDDRGLPAVVIEAKAPKVNIARDTDAIFQLLRYGRNLDTVPVGILTDFEEWEVYNTSMDPTKDTQRVRIPDLCLRYTDYATEWDKLEAHFSRPAVLEGKLRAFVTTTKTTLPLDYKFLKDLERYRKLIAQALVKGNRFAHDWDLNEATQRVLDRLLLLRILEDRGYGDRGGWLHRIAEADDPGRHLSDLVSRLQTTYNSRFFERHPVDDLRLEPGKLRKVVKELADPDSVYDFSAMPVEIIGKAYEQFLGSVIRTTPKQVRIEPKPEVRKAGGVYYTPRYIVDYIVENTLTPLFENKSLSQAAKIKILDPACGSGSFLIGAARWLGRWYSEKYGRPTNYEERQTIVLRHLHGVDIDSNAVEVTQLSLCLWLLEEAPLQLKMLHQALLPDLSGNIKCGNSLIGSDFYTSAGQQDLFDDAEVRHRVNAFDWDGPKGWPEIMKRGGFDAVIGNPPYLGGREWKKKENIYDYLVSCYETADYQFDVYVLFLEKGTKLLRVNGYLGFITPNTWLNNKSCLKLRKYILDTFNVVCIGDFTEENVFHSAVVLPIVAVINKKKDANNVVRIDKPVKKEIQTINEVIQNKWDKDKMKIINVNLTEVDIFIREHIEDKCMPLGSLAKIKFGIKRYETGKGIPPQKPSDAKMRVFEAEKQLDSTYRPYLTGKNVKRYTCNWSGKWLKYGVHLAAPRKPNLFKGKRLVFRRIMGVRFMGTIIDGDFVTSQMLQIVKPNDKSMAHYILGIINSTLMAYFFLKKFNRQDVTFPEVRIYELKSLPIRLMDSSSRKSVNSYGAISKLVERMLDLHKRLPVAVGSDKAQIEQLIARTDREIDRLVYELYDLTDDEIAIVEEAVKR